MKRLFMYFVFGQALWFTGGCGLILFNSPAANLPLEFNLSQPPKTVVVSGDPVFWEESIFTTIPGMTGHHASTITAFPDGELLAAWYSYPGPDEIPGSAIFTARKASGDKTWKVPELLIDRPQGDGNPVLYSEGDHVWLFQAVVPYGWSTAHIEFQQSEDRGKTWTQAKILNGELGSNTKYPPIRLADGTLLLPAYDDLWGRSLFFSSRDGTNWDFRSAVASDPGNLQPAVVELSTGQLMAVMRNKGGNWLWTMASDNQGKTWSNPQNGNFPNPGSAAQILRLADGNLILVFNDSETGRRPLSIAISADEGKTWPNKKIVATGDSSYSYPSAVQSPDGLIHIVYSLARDRIQHITLNEAWIASGQ
jgi:predicted neuraminidase